MNNIEDIDLKSLILSRKRLLDFLSEDGTESIRAVSAAIARCIDGGGTVYACGNGGSASQAEHFSAELVGRFYQDRRSLPVYSLAENGAVMSSLANDYSFDHVFAHQVAGVGSEGDCLLALSTSGNSENVVRACREAKNKGMHVFSLTGEGGGRVGPESDIVIAVPDTDTASIQEIHLLVVHLICQLVETALFRAKDGKQ